MNILVTGAAGFIGSNFCKLLLDSPAKYNVVGVDKLTYAGDMENVKRFDELKCFTFHQTDINNTTYIAYILKHHNIDCIVNFAAESHVDNSIVNCDNFINSNTMGVKSLLEAARHNEIKLFVQVSTDEVLGDCVDIAYHINGYTEDANYNPRNPYAASKASAEMLCSAYYHTYGVPVIITRCCNNYGPYQHPEKLVAKAITNIINNKPIPLYGDGKNIREWIHVTDHCNAILTLIGKGTVGEIYHIGSGVHMSNINILTKIASEFGKKIDDCIVYVTDRLGHDISYSLNCDKLKMLDWHCTTSFNQGIFDTVEWYKKNYKWWETKV